jgi:hypothetical protein
MVEWSGYVPESFKTSLTLVPTLPEPQKEGNERQKKVLGPGVKPPWEPSRFDSPEQKARLVAAWPQERQERWWYDEPLDDVESSKEAN